MENIMYIPIRQYCERTRISVSFVERLEAFDVIQTYRISREHHIHPDDINTIESLYRLHRDFGVNMEGLDIIREMMLRVAEKDRELSHLKKRLRLYE